ncbi:hypothetical protein [Maricaulis salignorans]|uniref:Uncharacterized protein n=1 Tax=Maricaulis salignorans TaxID=144026 RepID=A0A1G9TNI1_9PROT|nr:hypothetical protein [Maricaulis salignorans]SDM48984.1 hypothetical protein SAMN04488568_11259 [Maricaulis salignorans]
MKNGIFLVAVIAIAWGLAVACPASVRDKFAEATQIPEDFHVEADRQMAMFVSWARDDRARPVEDMHDRDLY